MAPIAEVTAEVGGFSPQNSFDPSQAEFSDQSEIKSTGIPEHIAPMEIDNEEQSYKYLKNIVNQFKTPFVTKEEDRAKLNKLTEFTNFLDKANTPTQEMLTRGLLYGTVRNPRGDQKEYSVLAFPTGKTRKRGTLEDSQSFLFDIVAYDKNSGSIEVYSSNYVDSLQRADPTETILDTLSGHFRDVKEFNPKNFIDSFQKSAPLIKELAEKGLFDTERGNQTENLLNTFSALAGPENINAG